MKKLNRKILWLVLFCFTTVVAVPNSSASIADRVIRGKVTGIDVIVYPMGVKDVVTFVGLLPTGHSYAGDGNSAVASITGMLLSKGTTSQDKFAIAKQLDNVGASIMFTTQQQMVRLDGQSLKKDLPMVIRLFAEELRSPAFPAEELEKAKKQFEGEIQSSMEDTNFRAQDAFSRVVFPVGHPNRLVELEEQLTAAQRLTVDDIKAFHKKYYGPNHLTLIFVGDVDAPLIQAEVGKAFAGWTGGVDVVRSAKSVRRQAPVDQTVSLKDKSSVSVVWGQSTGVRCQDPDSLALRVGTAILGGGFMGRLMSTVRDKEGLTYGIYAKVTDDSFVDGNWRITGTFAPTLLEKGISSTRRELEKWWQQGVAEEELAVRKTNMIGLYQVSLATTDGMAAAMVQALNCGKPLTWVDEYPKAINTLTLSQVNAAIQKYIDPKTMVLVKAGSLSDR